PLYRATELPPLPLPNRVVLGANTFPQNRVLAGTEGARVHLELPAIELSLSYVYGFAPLPGLNLASFNNPQTDQAQVSVSRTAYTQRVVGFDFATTLADWLGVRGEVAYRDPFRFRSRLYAPNPDFQYVLGLDHTFGDLSVIAQYIGRYTVNWQPRA